MSIKRMEESLTVAQVVDRHFKPGVTGWFTDGSCSPNPGRGGWGVVRLDDSVPLVQLHGADQDTTNNRMELTAIIKALEAIRDTDQTDAVVYSDSTLCIGTLGAKSPETGWAHTWRERGWKRKGNKGPENLDLVQRAFDLRESLLGVSLVHIKAHAGHYGNEYADCLATAWSRDEV